MRPGHRFALGFLVASCLALPARFLTGANVWTIPGTVNAAGLNDTRFVSDLAVTNPGSVPAQLTISLVPANATTPSQVTLAAGETIVYRNLLDRVWGAQGAGATKVTSGASLLIRARTYNTAASGTYGVALPVFADEQLLAPGQTANSLWISQSGDGSSGYRTNIAVVFPDDGGGAAVVTIFDADGNEVGSQDFALDAAGFRQFGVGGFAGAVPVARAEVHVTRGRAAGYSVVVDNITGDSSLFTFEELPTGYQDVVVNGVARANGRNSTFFRTDGRFFNPTDEDAVVKVSFHASGASNPTPVSGTFTIGSGRILDVVDVLGSLLGLPVGSSGALRFESDASVGILCRTSNVDPTGVRPGTFGAQQKPVPLLSFLMSADAPAVITGIRQDSSFRTNVGFAAGADGASYALTLKSAAGVTVAAATDSLGPFGWKQPNVQDLFPGTTIPGDATLEVAVTSGSVDVFDSSIDNASGDSVVTPVMPLPVNIPSSATIGPQGGSVRSGDGRITLKVPAGALAAPATVALTATAVAEPDALGSAYSLEPSDLPLTKPALLVFRTAGGPTSAVGLVGVSLALKTGSDTFVAMGGRVDPAAGTLSVPISSTSPSFSVQAPGREPQVAGPIAVLALRNLVLFPDNPSTLTDGHRGIDIFFKGPPTAGSADRFYLPFGDPRVTVRWRQTRLGNLHPTTAPSVTYDAPHRISEPVVRTDTKVTIRGPRGIRINLTIGIFIVRRDWTLETSVAIDQPCVQVQGVNVSPNELHWFGAEQVQFSIVDGVTFGTGAGFAYEIRGALTKKGSIPEATPVHPAWLLCPSPLYGFTAATETQPFSALDTQFETGDGGQGIPLANFDFEKRAFTIMGFTKFTQGSAQLTGPLVTPLNVGGGDYSLSVTICGDGRCSLGVSALRENEWFTSTLTPPNVTHRYRFISVDSP